MKKLIAVTSMITAITSSAFAKTEGHYVGADISSVHTNNIYLTDGANTPDYRRFKDNSVGFGVNYKHAFNFDRVFIAPGVFFDHLDSKAVDQDEDTMKVNHRYGAKLDVGYDVTDTFAAYVSAGVDRVNYTMDWKSQGKDKTDSKTGILFGVGLAYQICKDFTVNVEYNTQTIQPITPYDETSYAINEVKTRIDVTKIGVSYHF